MNRFRPIRRSLPILLLSVSLAAGSLAGELEPLPAPDLGGMEPAVADLLRNERASLDRLLQRTDADPALLAAGWGEMGFVYHAHGLLDAATVCYRNAERLAPEDFRWSHSIGALERQRGNLAEAQVALERTLTLEAKDFPALVYLGDVLLAQNLPDQADPVIAQAKAISDTSPAVLDLVGRLAMTRGDTQAAIAALALAVAQQPEAGRLQYQLGMAYRAANQLDQAREHLAKVNKIGVKPPDPLLDEIDDRRTGERLLLLEGRRAFGAGDFPAAVAAFRRAVEANPSSVRAQVNLAAALGHANQGEEAEAVLRRVLEQQPEQGEALFNLGVILRAGGRAADAVPLLEKAIGLSETDDGVRKELALAYRESGRLEDAERELVRVTESRPLDGDAQLALGEVRVRRGRYREATEQLIEAYRLEPENGALAYGLARLLAASPDPSVRNGEAAVELATLVVQAAPEPLYIELLALSLAEAGRCQEAAEVQRQLVALPNLRPAVLTGWSLDLARYQAGPPCRPPIDPAYAAQDAGAADETPDQQP